MPRSSSNRQAKLSDAASDGWDRLCRAHHVTYTALQEALGELAHAHDWLPPEVVDRAREIDRQRRSRT